MPCEQAHKTDHKTDHGSKNLDPSAIEASCNQTDKSSGTHEAMIGEMVQETDRRGGLRNPEPPPAKTCIETWWLLALDWLHIGHAKAAGNWACHGRYGRPKDKGKRGRSPKAAL